MTTIRAVRILALLAMAFLLAVAASAQKKSYTFHGKVTAVDQKTNKLTIDGEAVPGWMAAMTMAYDVDKPEVIKTLKAGDSIEATVYDGDYKLYNVKVVPPQKK